MAGGKVVPISRNSLGTLGEYEALYAFCVVCGRDRELDRPALLKRHGDLPLRTLRRRLRCSACGTRDAEIRRVFRLPGSRPTR